MNRKEKCAYTEKFLEDCDKKYLKKLAKAKDEKEFASFLKEAKAEQPELEKYEYSRLSRTVLKNFK